MSCLDVGTTPVSARGFAAGSAGDNGIQMRGVDKPEIEEKQKGHETPGFHVAGDGKSIF